MRIPATVLMSASLAAVLHAAPSMAEDAAPANAGYLNWSDNSVTLLPYGWGFAVDPSEQSALTFEHAQDSKIGDLFLFVDFTRYNNGSGTDENSWYGEVGPRLS